MNYDGLPKFYSSADHKESKTVSCGDNRLKTADSAKNNEKNTKSKKKMFQAETPCGLRYPSLCEACHIEASDQLPSSEIN